MEESRCRKLSTTSGEGGLSDPEDEMNKNENGEESDDADDDKDDNDQDNDEVKIKKVVDGSPNPKEAGGKEIFY